MINSRDIPEAIQWHEGMLLAPQHFQQMSLRNEELLHYHTHLAAPYHWGVVHLKVDPVLLVNGTFRIAELEAVMPDGLVVSHYAYDGQDIEVDLTAYTDDIKQAPVTIQLAVAANKNPTGDSRAGLARMESVEGPSISDANTGEDELRIPRLKPRLSLLVTEKPPKKYSTFPIARIAYTNESFSQTDYIPPTLSVPVKSEVGKLCADIAKRLREKAAFLSQSLRSPSLALNAPLILENKHLIQSLVGTLPQFEAILYSGVSHPFPLYLSLCMLTGHVAAVSPSMVPPILTPYDHNDLLATFSQAQKFIFRAIDEGILEKYTAIPMQEENGEFTLMLQKKWVGTLLTIGVRAQPGMATDLVMDWLNEAVIGSESQIPSMQEKRILGPKRQKVEKVDEFVPAQDVLIASIKVDSKFIMPEEVLHIFNHDSSAAQKPAEIVLYVKKQ